MNKKYKIKKGFTLVELVIVIAVIAVLAAVLIPTFSKLVEQAQMSACLQNAKNAFTEVYALDIADGFLKDTSTNADEEKVYEDLEYFYDKTKLEISWVVYDELSYTFVYKDLEKNITCVYDVTDGEGTWEVFIGTIDVQCDHKTYIVLSAVPATCIGKGLTEGRKCKKCGEIIEPQNEVEMLPHQKEFIQPKPQECCYEPGYTSWERCSVCGLVLKEPEEIWDQYEHYFVNGICVYPNCGAHEKDYDPNEDFYIEIDLVTGSKTITGFKPGKKTPIVTIPNGVTHIAKGAFQNETNITSVTLPESLISIGDQAFEGCWKLESINITKNVEEIGVGAFGDCSKLTKIDIDQNNTNFESVDGVLYNESQTELIQFPAGKVPTNGEYIIPDSVEKVCDYAFYGCEEVESVKISNVKTIGYRSFSSNSSLSKVVIENVEEIGEEAFSYCKLTSVTISCSGLGAGKTTIIKEYAFSFCLNLQTLYLGEGISKIGIYAFFFAGIQELEIPSTVTTIDAFAFKNCTSLTKVTYKGTPNVDVDAFEGCAKLNK